MGQKPKNVQNCIMNENLSIFMAFGAGLLSFLSPCVLPLIPSYLCVIGGMPMGAIAGKNSKYKPDLIIKTLFFVMGFSVVFITLSIVLTASFAMIGTRLLNRISGAIVIILGVNILFDFLPFLNYEKRFHISKTPRGAIGAFLTGAAFGAGWTPCVGPVLAGILMLAAQSGGIPHAIILLAFFSMGLGLPFVLASAFFDIFLKTQEVLRRRLPLIQKISGALLIIIGITMVTGYFNMLSRLAARM